jgi:protein-tyrosine phosphatase
MDWITDQIAIGDYREAQDMELMRRHKFRSVLGLISTLRGKSPEHLAVERIEIIELLDGPGNSPARFVRAIELLSQLVAEEPPVFVHCRAGWSRSPAVVAGYLMRSSGLSAEDALAAVAAKRSMVMAPELRAMLEEYK